ncbi:MAG TPA: acyltransferase [Actinobacteria bacterium]|nr:acyltransferase [Actinomycetota bacterium]
MTSRSSAADLAAATPEGRDRWIDFLRAFSIGAVVFGHWLVAVVVWEGGSVEGFNALERIPGFWPLTWVLQVMPLFFFVGGFSNLVSLRASQRRGEGYAGFLQGRFVRLMRPTIAFLAPAVVVVAVLDALNVADDFVFPVANLITGPLWFLGVYMIVIALTPPMASLHDRFGVAVPLVCVGLAIAVDVLRFGFGVSAVGFANYPIVWLLAHQWGFLYADRRLLPAHGRFLAPLGLAVAAALVALGPYPNSMVGLATDEFSNMDPPTLPIVALTLWEIGLAMLLRAPVARWLERRRPWTAVVAINGVIMTAFLWHLTVMVVAIGILFPLGFPQPEVGTGSWWLLRPPWIVCLLVLLGGFVALLGGIERAGFKRRHSGAPPNAVSALLAVVGAVATLWGVLGFAIGGLHQVFSPTGDVLIVLRLNPFQNVVHIAWGVTVMALADSSRRHLAAAGSFVVATALAIAGPLLRSGGLTNILALNLEADLLHAALAVVAAAAAVVWWARRTEVAAA